MPNTQSTLVVNILTTRSGGNATHYEHSVICGSFPDFAGASHLNLNSEQIRMRYFYGFSRGSLEKYRIGFVTNPGSLVLVNIVKKYPDL